MSKRKHTNKGLEAYCTTDKERAMLRSLNDTGGDFKKMAVQLGIKQPTIRGALSKLRARAARKGWNADKDLNRPVSDGFSLKGRSTLYSRGDDGEMQVSAFWLKEDRDREAQLEAMRAAIEAMAQPLEGRSKAKPFRGGQCNDDLLALYAIGDMHVGMAAWGKETGIDYDLEIAEDLLRQAMIRLVAAAPPAGNALVLSVGDWLHADNHSNRTPQSGHSLDVDSRHGKVAETGLRMAEETVEHALTKHKHVTWVGLGGNHDQESAMWMQIAMGAMFRDNPRVTICQSPRHIRYMTWGRCLIGTVHGDRVKAAQMPEVMASDAREEWGKARHCHVYTGHIHHKTVQEFRGCTVESLSVLCPGDAWHIAQGYRSKRAMALDVWDKRQGRILSLPGPVEYILNDETSSLPEPGRFEIGPKPRKKARIKR